MIIAEALKGITRLCIDTAPFIYFVERNPLYLERMRAIFKQIDIGAIQSFSSVVTLIEVLTQPIKLGKSHLEEEYREILTQSRGFTLVPTDLAIAERSAKLRARYNLKTPDAIQLATALQMNCEAFLANDIELKRVTELRVLILEDLKLDLQDSSEHSD